MFFDYIKRLLDSARAIRALFLDLIFPIECVGCRKEGKWICEDCFRDIGIKSVEYCLHCRKENDLGAFCSDCGCAHYIEGVWIAGSYEDKRIEKLIKSYKYHFVKDISQDLGRILIIHLNNILNKTRIIGMDLSGGIGFKKFDEVKKLPQVILDIKNCLVMPVPLSKKRERWRGFNQTEILARIVADHFGLRLEKNKLIRTRHKKPQAKLNAAARIENIKNCFGWQGENLKNKNIILIDDVVTTGSTLDECAKVLKENGAGEIWALVIARG